MNKILLKIFIINKDLNEENIEIINKNINVNKNKNKSMKIYNKEKVELAINDDIK